MGRCDRWLVLCVIVWAAVAICCEARHPSGDESAIVGGRGPGRRLDDHREGENTHSEEIPNPNDPDGGAHTNEALDDRGQDHVDAPKEEQEEEDEEEDFWEPEEHGEDEHADHVFDDTPAEHLIEHWGVDGHIDKQEISFLFEHLEHNTCHAHHGTGHRDEHGHMHHRDKDDDHDDDYDDQGHEEGEDHDDEEKADEKDHHDDRHDLGDDHHDDHHEDDHDREEERVVTPGMLVSRFGLYGALNLTGFEIACPMILMCQLEPGCVLQTGEEVDHHAHEESDDNTNVLKIVATLVLFVEAIVGALVPFVVGRFEQFKFWLSILNSFSGGIFMSAGFVHMIPVVSESEEKINELKNNYPLGASMVLGGFLLIFFIERVACGVEKANVDTLCNASSTVSSSVKVIDNPMNKGSRGSRGSRAREIQNSRSRGSRNSRNDGIQGWRRIKGPMVWLLAVSVHALLEAIALGLETGRSGVLLQFASMGSHKGVASMALAARLVRENASKKQVMILMGLFSLVAPVGILCSYAFSGVPVLIVLTLNGLAAGVFIYIGVCEVVVDEFGDSSINKEEGKEKESRGVRNAKFLAMVLGALLLSILQLIPHEHKV